MPIKLKTLPTGEVYWGQRHGQPVFYEPNESDAAFRQAAHDAIEITNLKAENEILTNAAQLGLSSAAVRINETVEAMRFALR